ncbi:MULTISPECIES: OmpA family protein [unclassified Streptomyces]|uniref:OmpA family protein n=1 Tax=unclassified Streptomyces TaxID=2593676 RepID=UPI0013BACDD1|nr:MULTISPECIES: OmpA family protein [unclassified Streptomyces]MCX5131159.1 OmpA family protein [Streptomyces sp. NBC_00340]MCX5278824.1 OmpA family protein [Streptomyces sp. NBC_00198]NEB31013.1 OmpA family protein [Streptomyces sp. SID14446]WSD77838.1 OmpA family protein [Streptomyces sp. NBC_01558]
MAATPRSAHTFTALAVLATLILAGGPAHADDDPSAPPGSVTTSPPPDVDANSPGLKLADGATLAGAKVLDIKSVVEDLGGEERREDTNADVTFALQAEVLFPKDSSKLNPDAQSRIQAIADEIKAQKATTVRVFGFTDNLGSYAHGLSLSKNRAEQVHDRLAAALGSSDTDITFEVRGYSEDYPIADNTSEQGRRKNRRVEVSFPRGSAGDAS